MGNLIVNLTHFGLIFWCSSHVTGERTNRNGALIGGGSDQATIIWNVSSTLVYYRVYYKNVGLIIQYILPSSKTIPLTITLTVSLITKFTIEMKRKQVA